MGDQDAFSSDAWSVTDVHNPCLLLLSPSGVVYILLTSTEAPMSPAATAWLHLSSLTFWKHDCLLCLVKTFSKMSFSPLNTGGLNNPIEDYYTLPDKSEPKDLDLTFIFVSDAN